MGSHDTTAFDNAVRMAVYDGLVRTGSPPDYPAIAARTGAPETYVREAVRRLAEDHVLVIDEAGGLVMAMPFAASQTSFAVRSSAGSWWANCAWDALGFAAMLDREVTVAASCARRGDALEFTVTADDVAGDDAVVHMLVPAAHWWSDIGFT